MNRAAVRLNGCADQSQGPRLAAGVDDRLEYGAVEGDGGGVQLVTGQRQLGEDNEP